MKNPFPAARQHGCGGKRTIIALSRTEGLTAVLVSPLSDSVNENFFLEASEVAGLTVVDGKPVEITKPSEEDPLSLKYEDRGETCEPAFDMAVVLTLPKVDDYRPETQVVPRLLKQELIPSLLTRCPFLLNHINLNRSDKKYRSIIMERIDDPRYHVVAAPSNFHEPSSEEGLLPKATQDTSGSKAPGLTTPAKAV